MIFLPDRILLSPSSKNLRSQELVKPFQSAKHIFDSRHLTEETASDQSHSERNHPTIKISISKPEEMTEMITP